MDWIWNKISSIGSSSNTTTGAPTIHKASESEKRRQEYDTEDVSDPKRGLYFLRNK